MKLLHTLILVALACSASAKSLRQLYSDPLDLGESTNAFPNIFGTNIHADAFIVDGTTNPFTKVVNVKLPPFNATGDGTTDDTAAITNAVLAATNGVLYFPAGTYRVTNTESKVMIRLYSNMRVTGAGASSIIKPLDDATTDAAVFYLGTGESGNLEVDNLFINGNGSVFAPGDYANENEGINIKSGTNYYFHDLTITDCGQDGLDVDSGVRVKVERIYSYLNGGNGIHFSGSGTTDFTIRNSSFLSNAWGRITIGGAAAEQSGNIDISGVLRGRIEGCFFDSAPRNISGNTNTSWVTITQNILRLGTEGTNIFLQGSSTVDINNNLFLSSGSTPISIYGGGGATLVTVKGNYLSASGTAILMDTNTSAWSIFANRLSGTVKVNSSRSNFIIQNTGGSLQFVGAGATNNYVDANKFASVSYSTTTAADQVWGLNSDINKTNNVHAGNGAALTFDASGFTGNLAATDNTVQELADAVDDLVSVQSYLTNAITFDDPTLYIDAAEGGSVIIRNTNTPTAQISLYLSGGINLLPATGEEVSVSSDMAISGAVSSGALTVQAPSDSDKTLIITNTSTADSVHFILTGERALDMTGTLTADELVADSATITTLNADTFSGNNVLFATNAASTSIDMRAGSQSHTLTGNWTATAANWNEDSANNSATILFVGDASSSYTVTIPTAWMTTDGANSWTVTNGQRGILTVNIYGGAYTNAAFRNLW